MTEQVWQLHITLVDSAPPIWRRFWVGDRTSLPALHRVVQAVMGWEDVHPYRFQMGGDRYEFPPYKTGLDRLADGLAKSSTPCLAELSLHPGDVFTYTYDFNDGWLHHIKVEAILPAIATQPTPICLAGECACPPEGCGGVWGYEGLLDRLEDPDDLEFDQLIERLSDFDPETFSLEKVNQRLQALTPV